MNVLITLIACAWSPTHEGFGEVQPMLGIESPENLLPPAEPLQEPVTSAVAAMEPMEGERAHGIARFQKSPEGLVVRGSIRGLKPGSTHAVHVHEGFRCGDDGQAAGSHFAPNDKDHGRPGSDASHAGDLGNVTANEDGIAELEVVRDDLAFDGDESVIVRTVVVHAGPDTFEGTAGKAGSRIACGTIVSTD